MTAGMAIMVTNKNEKHSIHKCQSVLGYTISTLTKMKNRTAWIFYTALIEEIYRQTDGRTY